LGGTDQKFNLLMGRKVQKKYNRPQQDIMTLPLLLGTDGVKKMSKSYDNYISLTDLPSKMYGAIMSIPDSLIQHYFKLLTNVSLKETKGFNNRDLKAKLAREIVGFYHGKKSALAAEKEFNRVFQEKKPPLKIPGIVVKENPRAIIDLLVEIKLAPSRAEAKRLILQKGVRIDGKVLTDWKKVVKLKKGTIVQVGKRRFAKIVLE